MAYVLDAGTTIMCPHGGQVAAVPATARVRLSGQPPLVVSDTFTVAACPLNISGSPSPCVRVNWLLPAMRVRMQGVAPLLSTSVGLCVNAAGAPQGTALVTGFQTRVSAT
jgi:hypothetical protein